ncbi:MAG: heterocyst frequency control protein PatD [Snowella sp.]|nr:heterocyst frequency control protein PatD [Snowella sp.]
MSSKTHLQILHDFLTLLDDFRESIIQPQPNAETVKQKFQVIENRFTNDILSVSDEEVNPKLLSIWQGLLTEMNRSLRLVKTDLAFFEAAIKAGKLPKYKRMQQNLDQIRGICSFCLKEA